MSSLTPDSFSTVEQAAIQDRLDKSAVDVKRVQSNVDGLTDLIAVLVTMDDANQRVQQQAISDVVEILHQIVKDRDFNGPIDEEPHYIVFGVNFPVTLADLYGADPFPTIPDYSAPVNGEILMDWELWQTPTGGAEVDPNQPDPGELTAAYPILTAEFSGFQEYRLNATIGSNVLPPRYSTTLGIEQAKLAVIQERNQFYLDLGFEVTS